MYAHVYIIYINIILNYKFMLVSRGFSSPYLISYL